MGAHLNKQTCGSKLCLLHPLQPARCTPTAMRQTRHIWAHHTLFSFHINNAHNITHSTTRTAQYTLFSHLSPLVIPTSPTKLLNIRSLARNQREWDDTRDVHLRPIDMHVKLQLLTHGLDVFKPLLVIRPGATDPDLHAVLAEQRGDLAQGADHAFECRCHL